MKKFPLWLASTVIAWGIFVPTKVNSQEFNTVLTQSNDTSVLARHYRYRRNRHTPVRYRRHGVSRRRHNRVYSPHRYHRRNRFSNHQYRGNQYRGNRYRGRHTSSFGIFFGSN